LNLIAAASQEAQAIFEISQLLGSSLSPNETISMMSSRLRRLVPFDCFALYLKAGNFLQMQYIDGERARSFSGARIPIGEGLSGWVAQSGRPMLNGNPKVEPNYEADPEPSERISSALSLPLSNLNGEVFGVLTLYSAEMDAFSRDHLRILQAVESKFSLSLQNALRFRNAEQDAGIDFITKLPNVRQFFFEMQGELDKARRSGQHLGVVVCDLNSFKAVNDLKGHLMGNRLLRSLAIGFRECCRSTDTVARIGGDEFVFLLPGLEERNCSPRLEAIEGTVERICRDLGIEIGVSASIGAAFYPADGHTVEELLGLADRRMYSHKQAHYETVRNLGDKRLMDVAAIV
jgi:diguanylate cyclase (GGDEF)-like protein